MAWGEVTAAYCDSGRSALGGPSAAEPELCTREAVHVERGTSARCGGSISGSETRCAISGIREPSELLPPRRSWPQPHACMWSCGVSQLDSGGCEFPLVQWPYSGKCHGPAQHAVSLGITVGGNRQADWRWYSRARYSRRYRGQGVKPYGRLRYVQSRSGKTAHRRGEQ